jgi:hypothetical protein
MIAKLIGTRLARGEAAAAAAGGRRTWSDVQDEGAKPPNTPPLVSCRPGGSAVDGAVRAPQGSAAPRRAGQGRGGGGAHLHDQQGRALALALAQSAMITAARVSHHAHHPHCHHCHRHCHRRHHTHHIIITTTTIIIIAIIIITTITTIITTTTTITTTIIITITIIIIITTVVADVATKWRADSQARERVAVHGVGEEQLPLVHHQVRGQAAVQRRH